MSAKAKCKRAILSGTYLCKQSNTTILNCQCRKEYIFKIPMHKTIKH